MAVHQMLLAEHGGAPGLRSKALLESALNRPQRHYEYADDPTLFDLAAAYCHGLVRNHPFVDGNKRLGLVVAAMFLEINGHSLTAPEPEAVVIIQRLASGEMDETQLAAWLAASSRPQAGD